MNQIILKCPKCDGEMEQGYTLDFSHGVVFPGSWLKGTPMTSWFDFFRQGVIQVKNPRARVPIGTFRCASCGYLESYAREEFRPE